MKTRSTPTRQLLVLTTVLGLAAGGTGVAQANLLSNGNLDATVDVEVSPGFSLPHPAVWVNVGSKTISGPYQDDLSSEVWAGPAPTPVTTDGMNGDDWGVFFKAFGGNIDTGDLATGHLYQDVPATPGVTYVLTGWAGAEANYSGFIADSPTKSLFSLTFLDGASTELDSVSLDLVAAGLGVDNGEAFNYKQYSLMGTAPAGTAMARVEVAMIDGYANPAGGGQAFVVDDFDLSVVPEPTTFALIGIGLASLIGIRRRR